MSEVFTEEVIEFVKRNQSGTYDAEKAYQKVKKLHHPGNKDTPAYRNSGVTVSYGIDLGGRTPAAIQAGFSGIVPKQTLEVLKTAAGLKGDEARQFVLNNKQIQLSKKACDQAFYREIKTNHIKWCVDKFNNKEFKDKFEIKDGNDFLRNMPSEVKKIMLDTKYWGQNNPVWREKVMPMIKKITDGKASSKEKENLYNKLNDTYKGYPDRHNSFKDLMSKSQVFKPTKNVETKNDMTFLNNFKQGKILGDKATDLHKKLNGQPGSNLGGIDLSFDISTAYYDGFFQGKQLIQLHKGSEVDASLKDLIVPLKIMYDQNIKSKNISVSIDPLIPTQPDGPQQVKVFYPKQLEETRYGQVMIEADLIMKQLKMGVDGRNKPFQYPQSLKKVGIAFEDLLKYRQGAMTERTRQWIVIKKVETVKMHGNRVIIGDIKMGVEARVQSIGQKGTLADTEEKPSKATQKFCELFDQHYDIIAKQYPQFAALKRLAKASIIARTMYQKGCQINFKLINQLYELEKVDKSSKILPTLVNNYYYEKLHANLKIIGGCDLTYDVSKNQNPEINLKINPDKQEMLQTDTDQVLTDAQIGEYAPFLFQSAVQCNVQDCQNLCNPDHYSVKNSQCSTHSRMKCTQCNNLITIGEKYKDVCGGYCHARCFKCFGCQKPLESKYLPYWKNEYYHIECVPQPVLGTCDICKLNVTTSHVSMKRGDTIYLHKECVNSSKCKACQQSIPVAEIKFVNNDTYHKSCVICIFCNRVIEEPQFKIMQKGFSHPQCMPKIHCQACKRQFTGPYITIGGKTYHSDCLKCHKCGFILDTKKGVKTDKEKNLYHAECPKEI